MLIHSIDSMMKLSQNQNFHFHFDSQLHRTDKQIHVVNANVDVDDAVNAVNLLHSDHELVVVKSLLHDHVEPLRPSIQQPDDVMIEPWIFNNFYWTFGLNYSKHLKNTISLI